MKSNPLKRKKSHHIFILLFICSLASCASYDQVAYPGMSKQDFISKMAQNEMVFESIYHDLHTGFELLIPKNYLRYNPFSSLNKTAKFAVFKNVTRPYPRWIVRTMRVPDGHCGESFLWGTITACHDVGDGFLQESYTLEEIIKKASEGDNSSKKILTIYQLHLDKLDSIIKSIAKERSISEKKAKRILSMAIYEQELKYRESKKIELENDMKLSKQIAKKSEFDTNRNFINKNRVDKKYQSFTYTKDTDASNENVSKSLNIIVSFFGELIVAVIEAYIDNELGLVKQDSKLSSSDKKKIEDAYKRGLKKGSKKQNRMKDIQWTAPIR